MVKNFKTPDFEAAGRRLLPVQQPPNIASEYRIGAYKEGWLGDGTYYWSVPDLERLDYYVQSKVTSWPGGNGAIFWVEVREIVKTGWSTNV